MKMICTVWLLLLVSCASVAQTRSKTAILRDKQNDLKRDKLRASGGAALQRVKDSMKTDRCASYGSGVPGVECLVVELHEEERDERIYARAITGMLRLVDADNFELPTPSERRYYQEALGAGREFDAGEIAWRRYRDKGCHAIYDYYAGGSIRNYGTINCRLSLTQNHMLEMETQYVNLWH